MTPQQYDAWYGSPRGRWIGDTEYRLLNGMLAPSASSSILDIGCGTGYFSRRFARDGHAVTGVDIDPAMIGFARAHRVAGEDYFVADALALPFGDRAFDYCISVTALCFVRDERRALEEMARVARRGLAVGLLNRRSLLYWKKGRHGGTGAYRGAHWHTAREAQHLLAGLPLDTPAIRSAVYFPWADAAGRWVETQMSGRLLCGAFLGLATGKS
ncbi:MAG: class I SAM-dependent methyltransferase [Betaproteobacteria bacterium]|nr:MAG: class I SAM-dependent methyltransferase [Betaproteobacteria bacterium]